MMNFSQTAPVESELLHARHLIGTLQEELAETNRGLVALTMELEDRVHERTRELQAKSTGPGLAIGRRITEEHQGMITIESETGVGTTVTSALPVMHQRADS